MAQINITSFYTRSISNSEGNVSNILGTSNQGMFHAVTTAYQQIMLLLCILGLPGNLFVVVIYIRKMTTSMRAYMFALGVVDTVICVCFLVMLIVYTDKLGKLILVFVLNTAVIFSTCLLAFLATERCLAIAKPHKFTLSTGRAKTALVVNAAFSVCYSAMLTVTLVFRLMPTYLILTTGLANACFIIVIASYGAMAVILLKRMRSARRQIGAVAMTSTSTEVVAITSMSTTASMSAAIPKTTAGPVAAAKPSKAAQAQRGTLVLFVVTAVFILCWLPFFLKNYGLPITDQFKRVFVINSIVNPFIYSFLSPMFRSDVRSFFYETRKKLCSCC